MNYYYSKRAQAAHAAAEAATDPRDKAAWRSAAQTWEKLAKPAKDTYSLEPLQRQLNALKKDVVEINDNYDADPIVTETVETRAVESSRRFNVKKPAAIEF